MRIYVRYNGVFAFCFSLHAIYWKMYMYVRSVAHRFNIVFFIVQGLYSETGFYIDMDRNFVC